MPPARRSTRLLGLLLVFLGCLLFAVRGYRDQTTTLQSFDFKPVYGAARCLLDRCDPYDSAAIQREFLAHGGDPTDLRPFRPFNSNYPPSALALVTPFALLPFGPAHLLWLALSTTLFSMAALLTADLCLTPNPAHPPSRWTTLALALLLAAFVSTSTMLLMLAQPAGIAIGFLGIATWCLLRGRHPALAVLAFALALTLKPHLGALLWLFFLLVRPAIATPAVLYRRRALEIATATILLSLPGLIWASTSSASAHWPTELRQNLRGIAAHGNASDPGPANNEAHDITSLQAALSVLRDQPSFYNSASLTISAALFFLWLAPVLRTPANPQRDLLAIAAIVTLSLLPIYHRQYDTRLLLLTFPALAILLASQRRLGLAALTLTSMAVAVTTHSFPHVADRLLTGQTPPGKLLTLFAYRPMPIVLLTLTAFYLFCLYRQSSAPRPLQTLHRIQPRSIPAAFFLVCSSIPSRLPASNPNSAKRDIPLPSNRTGETHGCDPRNQL